MGAPGPLGPHEADAEAGRGFVVDAVAAVVGVLAGDCLGDDVDVEAGEVREPLDADADV